LDRGELDKIIERSASQLPPSTNHEASHNRSQRNDKDDHYNKKKKRKSFLGDLLDF